MQTLLTPHYHPDKNRLLARAMLPPGSGEAEAFLHLVHRLHPLARPKAFILAADVSAGPEAPDLAIGGVMFSGRVLHEQLKAAKTVWPYLATCGQEAYDAVQALSEPLERFWGEMILEDILETGVNAASDLAATEAGIGRLSSIAPGSSSGWPIEQQTPLFTLLGNGAQQCGVTLTEARIMVPSKSVSAIFFPSEHGYVSCTACSRENCPNRKTSFKP